MSLPVRRTNQADADLDSIWLHVAADSVRAAEKLVERIEAAEDQLGVGQAQPELGAGIRHWPVQSYVIFYRADPDAVTTLRILHGARDLPSIL
jgi:toxin ParE1/3/4